MPLIPSSRNPVRPRRRSVLLSAGSAVLASGAALLAGCSGGPGSTGSTRAAPSAEERARARAARDSEELAARYEAVIAAHPRLAARLAPLRDQVRRHAEAFAEGLPASSAKATASGHPSSAAVSSAPSPAPSGPAASSAGTAPPPPAVPADEGEALAALVTAERGLADRRTEALLTLPGEPARLFASVAAAGAAHAYLLTEGLK